MDINIPEVLVEAGFEGAQFSYSDMSLSSMRGPCPRCGGTRRLLMFVDNPLPFWNFSCDNCGFKGKSINVDSKLKGQKITGTIEMDKTEQLEQLNNSSEWIEFHNSLNDDNRTWLKKRGLPLEYQDRWVLGFTNNKAFVWKDEVFRSPAYTIPKINHDLKLVNIDYRLLEFPENAGKYRSVSGVPTAEFITSPGRTDHDRLFIVEGSFKAMVLCVFLEKHGYGNSQVIGLPGITSKLYRNHAYDYPEVFVMLDPDGPTHTRRVAREINAKPIFMPSKIDDAIVSGLSWDSFVSVIENSGL